MKNGQTKHDTLCKIVSYHLNTKGWQTLTNKYYNGWRCGEIDVIGIKNNYMMYVEVKCCLSSKNKRKALDQLDRAYRYCDFHKDKKLFTVLAYEKKGEIQYEWIKQR